jgi:hypothetical protein
MFKKYLTILLKKLGFKPKKKEIKRLVYTKKS